MYLVATGTDIDALEAHPNIGIMTGPRTGGLAPVRAGRPWATDCDALATRGYDEDAYLRHLERMQPYAPSCLFAVVPDLPGDGEATRCLYDHAAPLVAQAGFPLAYVLQDGCEALDLPSCDVVFLGGTDPWRLRWGAELLERAWQEGRRTHVGRVNSRRRLRALGMTRAQSADGTYLGFRGAARGLAEIGGWLSAVESEALFSPGDFMARVA